MIETTEQLQTRLQQASQGASPPICAIDTEADSLHRYRESLCLIQFVAADEPFLIDPLAIKDMAPLWDYLSRATVWMHGADYDMTMIKRECGVLPPIVFDTQIGARLLGARRFGLGDLVQSYFGIELCKTSQKADWGKRPLSAKMVEYALNDVRYLLEMGEKITDQLKELGRYGWFLESCVAARDKVLQRDDSKEENWRIQGAGKLEPFGLACLRALWQWRDAEAKAWDRPSFMVVTNHQLAEWATELASGHNITLPHHFRPDRIKRLRASVAGVEAIPEAEWPKRIAARRRKRDRDFERRLEELIQKREDIAARLNIEGSLIAPRAVLESVAGNEATPGELLLRWQLEILGFEPDAKV